MCVMCQVIENIPKFYLHNPWYLTSGGQKEFSDWWSRISWNSPWYLLLLWRSTVQSTSWIQLFYLKETANQSIEKFFQNLLPQAEGRKLRSKYGLTGVLIFTSGKHKVVGQRYYRQNKEVWKRKGWRLKILFNSYIRFWHHKWMLIKR